MSTRIGILITALSIGALVACASRQEEPFTLPDASVLNDDLRGGFVAQFHRGEALYRASCAGCHNVKVDGRMIIPDFSAPQLLDYEMRMQYPSHGERLHESKVSKEELDDIQVFLLHRKPSGHPVAPPPVPGPPPKMN